MERPKRMEYATVPLAPSERVFTVLRALVEMGAPATALLKEVEVYIPDTPIIKIPLYLLLAYSAFVRGPQDLFRTTKRVPVNEIENGEAPMS